MLRSCLSFIRWRLVPVRYITMLQEMKFRRIIHSNRHTKSVSLQIKKNGFSEAPTIPLDLMERMKSIYLHRGGGIKPQSHGHPFVNLFNSDDINENDPICQYAFSQQVLDVASDYFEGNFILDSIQVLYSYPTDNLRESQLWHLDYGDKKSFHSLSYLTDVQSEMDGPFVFLDKETSSKIGRSLIVKRLHDNEILNLTGEDKTIRFLGKAGSAVYVDPAVCYHYGSRCRQPRVAVFVTFNGRFPFAKPMPIVAENRHKLLEVAVKIRPDLAESFLTRLLQLD